MVKNKPKKVDKQSLFNIVISVFVLFLTLMVVIAAQDTINALSSHVQIDFINNRERIAEHTILQFCYDHDIRPCDEAALKAWNATHPDDTFSDWPR